jgi:hypothetical protein
MHRTLSVLPQVLHEDVEAALTEASLAQERAALLGMEQDELQQQRDQLAGAATWLRISPAAIDCRVMVVGSW